MIVVKVLDGNMKGFIGVVGCDKAIENLKEHWGCTQVELTVTETMAEAVAIVEAAEAFEF